MDETIENFRWKGGMENGILRMLFQSFNSEESTSWRELENFRSFRLEINVILVEGF